MVSVTVKSIESPIVNQPSTVNKKTVTVTVNNHNAIGKWSCVWEIVTPKGLKFRWAEPPSPVPSWLFLLFFSLFFLSPYFYFLGFSSILLLIE